MKFFESKDHGNAINTQLLSKLFSVSASVLTSSLTARYLGPSIIGIISFAASLIAFATPITSFAIDERLRTVLSEKSVDNKKLIVTSLFLRIVGGSLLVAFFIFFCVLNEFSSVKSLFIIVSCSLYTLNFSEYLEIYLFNQNLGAHIAKVNILAQISLTAATCLAVVSQASLALFAFIPFFPATLKTFFYIRKSKFDSRELTYLPSSSRIKSLLHHKNIYLVLSSFAVALYMKGDIIMIEAMKGSIDVGLYSISVRTVESLWFYPMILYSTYFPIINSTKTSTEQDLTIKKLYKKAWIGAIIALLISCVFPYLILLVYGQEYKVSSEVLPFLIPATLPVFLGVVSSPWLMINGLEKYILARTAGGAIANILLNLILIPRFGIFGAAIATSISYTFATFGLLLVLSQETRRHCFTLLCPWV